MDQPVAMHPADGGGEGDSNPQELRHIQGTAEKPIEGLATGIRQHQGRAAAARRDRQRTCRPASVEYLPQRVFMLEALGCPGEA